jgi:hypothetical protein
MRILRKDAMFHDTLKSVKTCRVRRRSARGPRNEFLHLRTADCAKVAIGLSS